MPIVRAGAPLSPGQVPLFPTRIRTIEGAERFGGSFRRPTGGAGAAGGGRLLYLPKPQGLGSRLVVRGSRGLGSNIQYCDYNPPDATTAAQIKAAGNTYSLISCASGTTTNPANPGGTFQNSATAYVGPQPVYAPPATPAYANCDPSLVGEAGSTACAAANQALQTAWENAVQAAQQKFNQNMCVWNGQNPTYCAQLYSGAGGASGSPGAGVVPTAPQYLPTGGGPAAGGVPSLVMIDNSTGVTNPASVTVGNSWTVKVSGVPAGANVVAQLSGPSGSSTYQAGAADGNGNLTLSGAASSDQVGSWTEQWSANGQAIGTLSFSIVAPAAQSGGSGGSSGTGAGGSGSSSSGAGAGGQSSSGSGGGSGSSSGGALDIGALLTGSAIAGIPNWALALGAVGLVALLAGGKH